MKKTKKLSYSKETIKILSNADLRTVGGAVSLLCGHSVGITECVCTAENCTSTINTAQCEPSYHIC